MTSQTAWNQLSAQQLIERAYEVAEALQGRDEEEAAGLLRHLAWRFKGSEEWAESLKK
ncbi:MAG: hypothetical protein CMLOHMNK_03345 [Steroidobacteraceae bacterium]|nr:hypothetical protein [Steroidobacteraceae bacterium]